MGLIYFIIKILTLPGTMFKAFMEQLSCRMFGVPVEFSRYIQKNELCGHVEHMLSPARGSFGICFMPHIVTLFCGLCFILPSSMNLFYLGKVNIFSCIFIYFGLSFLMNCFPLIEDAVNIWENLYGKDSHAKLVSKIFMAVPAVVMFAGAYLERYCVTFITSIAFAYGLPYLIAWFIQL